MRVTDANARVLAACVGLLFAAPALAQSPGYPDRPVKIIVPFAAAGPTDVVARLIALKLSEKFSQQFYIENMAGAGGNLGMGAAARAPADGYTVLFVSSSYTVNPSLYAKPPYDPDKDFAPVTKAAGSPNGLFVTPSIPAKSVKDGKLRALAVTAATRSPALPDAPTLDELGIKNQEAETIQGVLLPAGTPKSIVDLLQTEIARIIHLPDVKDKLLAIGLEPDVMSPATFAAYIKADVAKWKRVIADAKIPQIGG